MVTKTGMQELLDSCRQCAAVHQKRNGSRKYNTKIPEICYGSVCDGLICLLPVGVCWVACMSKTFRGLEQRIVSLPICRYSSHKSQLVIQESLPLNERICPQ